MYRLETLKKKNLSINHLSSNLFPTRPQQMLNYFKLSMEEKKTQN